MSSKAITRQVNLYLNDKGVDRTIKNIAAEYKILHNHIKKNLIEGTKEYIAETKKLSALGSVLTAHRNKVRGTEKAWMASKLSVGNFVGFLAAGATAQTLINAGGQLFNIASQMELGGQKAQTVFGPALNYITKEARENAAVMGLTNAQFVQMATNVGDLLIPMGFTRKEAAGISNELTNLSGALSEWTAGKLSAEEVSQILAKAMLGEREQLKTLGIAIKESDVTARLAEKGLKGLTGQMLEQAKAAVTLELITEKSTDAQTAFAESTGSLVRDKAELTARTRELTERLATTLVPTFIRLVEVADSTLTAIESLSRVFAGSSQKAEMANRAYYDQVLVVNELDESLVPLLERHDELTEKTVLNEEEQAELRDVIAQIAEIVPTATTEVDNYGVALGINAEKAKQFYESNKENIELFRDLSKEQSKERIEQLTKEQAELNKIVSTGRVIEKEYRSSNKDFIDKERILTTDELRKKRDQLIETTGKLNAEELKLTQLNQDPNEVLNSGNDDTETPDAPKATIVPTRKALDAAEKKLQAHLDRVQKLIDDGNTDVRNSLLTEEEAKIQDITDKYQKEIDLLRESKEEEKNLIIDLERLKQLEIANVRDEYLTKAREEEEAKELELLDADIANIEAAERRKTEAILAEQLKRAELQNEIKELLLSEEEAELAALEAMYGRIIQLAEQAGLDTTEIVKKYETDKDAIRSEQYDKEVDRSQKQRDLQIALFENVGSAFESLGNLVAKNERQKNQIQRLAALAQIGLDTAKSISSVVAAASASSPDPVVLAIKVTTGIAAVLASMAKAKEAFAASPTVPQRKKGRWFSARGADDGVTYNAQYLGRRGTGMLPDHPSLVLGSEKGREYFVSNDALNNPQVMNHVAAIDAIQANRVPQFQDGGSTAPIDFSTAQAPAAASPDIEKLNTFLDILIRQGVMAQLTDDTIVGSQRRLTQLNDDSGGALL